MPCMHCFIAVACKGFILVQVMTLISCRPAILALVLIQVVAPISICPEIIVPVLVQDIAPINCSQLMSMAIPVPCLLVIWGCFYMHLVTMTMYLLMFSISKWEVK